MGARRAAPLLSSLVVERPGAAQSEILAELRRAILDGAVPPGTPIPVGEVANRFGVSHIPIREALKTLCSEGLVDHRGHAGYAVAVLTATELREIYIVRESLELAALAASCAVADDAERLLAAQVNDALETDVAAGDRVAYHRHSREFHLALARPSRMVRLLHMLESAWNITEPIQPMVHVAPHVRVELHADHRAMLAAFVDRDAAGLLAAAQAHNERLNLAIATLPTDTGLLAFEDISSPKRSGNS